MEELRFIELDTEYYSITVIEDKEVTFHKFGITNYEIIFSIDELNSKFEVGFTFETFKKAVVDVHHKVIVDMICLMEKYYATNEFNEQKIQVLLLELFGYRYRGGANDLFRERGFKVDIDGDVIIIRLYHLGQEVYCYAFKESFLNTFFHITDFTIEFDFLMDIDDEVLAEKIYEYFNVGFYHVNREKLSAMLRAHGRKKKISRLL